MNRHRAWREQNPAKVLLYQAKRRARLKGVPFGLTLSDVEALFAAGRCEYCGIQVGMYGLGGQPQSASLDRLVPSVGYTPANTILACHKDNSAKSEHTPETLRAWATKIETLMSQRQNPTETE